VVLVSGEMVSLLRSAVRYAGVAACCFVIGATCGLPQTADPAQPSTQASKPMLPASLAGWSGAGAMNTGTSSAAIDAANADVLKEFGLKDFAQGTYRRGNSTLNLRAMRFADATGAYGAFTFYRKPDMRPEEIGNRGAGDAHEAVFWSGGTVVDATFQGTEAIEQPVLKALAAELPPAGGSSGVAPTLPGYLPTEFLDGSTIRYAIGPAGYVNGGGVLPPDAIDFGRDAEVVTAQYSIHSDQGRMTLIEYPTPQMAIHSEEAIEALLKGSLPATLQQSKSSALAVRRSGPLVAMTSGNFSSDEAQALLAQVSYRVDVTWNRGAGNFSKNEVKNAAEMLFGIATLFFVLGSCAVVLGFFFGGGRAVWRVMHGKPASSVYEEDFICLNLSGWLPESPRKTP
jgi:hypothetical protein